MRGRNCCMEHTEEAIPPAPHPMSHMGEATPPSVLIQGRSNTPLPPLLYSHMGDVTAPTPPSLSLHTGERQPFCPHPYPHTWEKWSQPPPPAHTQGWKWLHSSSSQMMSDVCPRFWTPKTFIHSTCISGWPLTPTAALRVGAMNSAATFAWAPCSMFHRSQIFTASLCWELIFLHSSTGLTGAPMVLVTELKPGRTWWDSPETAPSLWYL